MPFWFKQNPLRVQVKFATLQIPYLYHKLPPSLTLKPTILLTQLTRQQQSVTVHLILTLNKILTLVNMIKEK